MSQVKQIYAIRLTYYDKQILNTFKVVCAKPFGNYTLRKNQSSTFTADYCFSMPLYFDRILVWSRKSCRLHILIYKVDN